MDVGTFVGAVFLAAFLGIIVGGELLSRRKRARAPRGPELPQAPARRTRGSKRDR